MISHSGRTAITYNGEIYSEPELRAALGASPSSFHGTSDTEVLLEACEVLGVHETLPHVIGMFAFGVYDITRRRLTLGRDRLGIKPLYWSDLDGALIFASELKSLIQHPEIQRDLDQSSIGSFLRFDYIPAPHSILRSVQKLEAGCTLSVDASEGPRIERYWNLRESVSQGREEQTDVPLTERMHLLEELLKDSVRRRLVSDVPIGALLSGGIDSSLVTAMMVAEGSQTIRTFSVGFTESQYDESRYARKVAQHLGTDHTALVVESRDALSIVPHISEHYSEPFADSSQIPTLLISQLISEELKVVLTGDGGDETFGGYGRYLVGQAMFRETSQPGLPLGVAGSHASALIRSVVSGHTRPTNAARKLRSSLKRYLQTRNAVEDFDSVYAYRDMMSHWRDLSMILDYPSEHVSIFDDNQLRTLVSDPLAMMRYADMNSYLPDDILVKVDRASMAFGLEARVPLLDHRLVGLSWSFTDNELISGGRGKIPLRAILETYVPKHLFERPKMGFGVPVAEWLRSDLQEWAADLLASRSLTSELGLNERGLEATWTQHLQGQDHAYALWSVLMLLSWLDTFRRWT